jgi:hypothetical protein
MKKTLLVLMLAAAGCSVGSGGVGAVSCGMADQAVTPQSGSVMPASIIDPYLNIQMALADDSIEPVRSNAGNIATAAAALGAPAMKIDTAAVQLASAGDLEDARQRFGVLSEAIETYAKGLNLKMPEGVRVAYCPMAQKPWLQKGSTISNPYYGKSMLTCGDFR